MKRGYLISTLILICLLISNVSNAQSKAKKTENQTIKESSVLIRPNTNIGFLNGDFVYSIGFRTLLKAGENKSYGIEVSRYNYAQNSLSFFTAGIILEQKLFGWFNMSIGTIGYFNFGINSENAVGLTSNLGWEPYSEKRISPYITYRSDFIFTSEIESMNSLNIGLNIKL